MKNLVVCHLESLSWNLFNTWSKSLPDLSDLMKKSNVYKKYFSSATSSIMAVSDFLYGNNFELDSSVSFDAISHSNCSDSLLKILENNGYRTLGIGYPLAWRDDLNNFKIWDSANPFSWEGSYDSFIKKIESFVKEDGPFFLYFWDLRSHLYYEDDGKRESKNIFERLESGYSALNGTLAKVMELLGKYELVDDSVVLGFGDHGDEFWEHGFNGGFCHSNEPFTNLINCPLFIFDGKSNSINDEKLVSLVDLKSTALGMLGIKYSEKFKFAGVDISSRENNYVFSQNLFTAQDEMKDLRKAYSVTNDLYHLIVSNLGLEMYAYTIDPNNHNNLLSFFDFDGVNEAVKFRENKNAHPHFQKVFSEGEILNISRNFDTLYSVLKDNVLDKVMHAKKMGFNGRFNMTGFDKIRERKYIW